MKFEVRILFISMAILVAFSSFALAVVPSGVTPVEINSTSAPADAPTAVSAIAGNVTELNIVGVTTTQTWQGYYGNVSGTIQLADAADKVLYNWSLANPEGEIYASVNSSINWVGTICFDVATKGSALESQYGIISDDVDGINETFNEKVHSEFYVNNIQIAANTCDSIEVYDSSGQSTAGNFEEVILEGGSGEVIFVAILEEGSVAGFDGRDHDFEMLVLEDGHGSDTATTPYYFYVEIQ